MIITKDNFIVSSKSSEIAGNGMEIKPNKWVSPLLNASLLKTTPTVLKQSNDWLNLKSKATKLCLDSWVLLQKGTEIKLMIEASQNRICFVALNDNKTHQLIQGYPEPSRAAIQLGFRSYQTDYAFTKQYGMSIRGESVVWQKSKLDCRFWTPLNKTKKR